MWNGGQKATPGDMGGQECTNQRGDIKPWWVEKKKVTRGEGKGGGMKLRGKKRKSGGNWGEFSGRRAGRTLEKWQVYWVSNWENKGGKGTFRGGLKNQGE